MSRNEDEFPEKNNAGFPVPVDRLGKTTGRIRRLAIRFKDLTGLEKISSTSLSKGVIFVPDSNPSPVETQVELTISLPTCNRLIQVDGTVKAILKKDSGRVPGMLLAFGASTAYLQGLITKFLEGCKGERCGPDGEMASTLCDLIDDSGKRRNSSSTVVVVPAADSKPIEQPKQMHNVRIDTIPRVRPDLLSPERRTTLVGMQRAPGKPGLIRPPNLPPPPGEDPGDKEKAENAGGTDSKKIKRRPSLLNIPIFGRKKKEKISKEIPVTHSPKLVGTGREKASTILKQAEEAMAQGSFEKAINLLRMALAFDPLNQVAKDMLDEAESKYKPTFGL
ncbi:MAG: hypothetical protein GXP49_17440 [Deltaproteobacteria bacterium]|nr:hypothetical protein [Deltaproteobacteria bacterium]